MSLLKSAQAICTHVIGTVSSEAICTNMVSTVSGNAVGAYVVSTVSSDAVGTYVVSTVSSDATNVGMGRTVFCNDRGIHVFAGINSWKCKSAAGKNRESQAEDQFVSFHGSCSRSI